MPLIRPCNGTPRDEQPQLEARVTTKHIPSCRTCRHLHEGILSPYPFGHWQGGDAPTFRGVQYSHATLESLRSGKLTAIGAWAKLIRRWAAATAIRLFRGIYKELGSIFKMGAGRERREISRTFPQIS